MVNCTIGSADGPIGLLAVFGMPMGMEWIVLLVLGLLIFGRRLPEVGRSLGRGIVEFKRGIRGLEDEVEDESARPSRRITDQPSSQELPRSQATQTIRNLDDENPYAAVPDSKSQE